MRSGRIAILVILAAWASCGCATVARPVCPVAAPPPEVQAVVFVADGAGGFKTTSKSIREAIEEAKLPLAVQTFEWSHDWSPGSRWCKRIIIDHLHRAHARAEGRRLGETIRLFHEEHPELPIHLVSYSAGCYLALVAAESLPPETLETITLLSPSVSCKYDLRPALRCVRQNVDCYYSNVDKLALKLGTGVFGTGDGPRLAPAGRIGFQTADAEAKDPELYAKLRQYPWNESLKWTGHDGGHWGAYQRQYLLACVPPFCDKKPDDAFLAKSGDKAQGPKPGGEAVAHSSPNPVP